MNKEAGIIIGVVAGVIVLIILLVKKGAAEPPPNWDGGEPPPPPPPIVNGEIENYGRIQGYVKNKNTGEPVTEARIFVDGHFHLATWSKGDFRTDRVRFGIRQFEVKADNFQTFKEPIAVASPLMNFDPWLTPMVVEPTPWTAGIEIERVRVEPSVVVVGEPVRIIAEILAPVHSSYPMTVYGTVKVDGESITKEFTLTFRNPSLYFDFTPKASGTFTIKALDKSTVLEVYAVGSSTYYSPFGGIRIPICREISIQLDSELWTRSGFSSFYTSTMYPLRAKLPPDLLSKLHLAFPSKWDCGTVSKYGITRTKGSRGDTLIVVPLEFNCQPYWNSPEELAQMIARAKTAFYTSAKAVALEYGVTCSTCKGTGQNPDAVRWFRSPCKTCGGVGKTINFDLVRGLKDRKVPIKFGSGGYLPDSGWIECPHCRRDVGTTYKPYPHSNIPWLEIARKLLLHIERDHPDKPLTSPDSQQAVAGWTSGSLL